MSWLKFRVGTFGLHFFTSYCETGSAAKGIAVMHSINCQLRYKAEWVSPYNCNTVKMNLETITMVWFYCIFQTQLCDQYFLFNQQNTYFQSHNNGRVGIPGLLAIVPQIQRNGHVHVQIIRASERTAHKPKIVQLPIVQVNRPRGYKT